MPGASRALDAGREAVRRVAGLRRELDALEWALSAGVPWRTRGSGVHARGGAGSDPTAAAATDEGGRARAEELAAELAEAERAVGVLLALVEGCRAAWGDSWAETVELYYVDAPERERLVPGRLGWSWVAEVQGIAPSTAWRRDSAVRDWIDEVGVDGAVAGRMTKGAE